MQYDHSKELHPQFSLSNSVIEYAAGLDVPLRDYSTAAAGLRSPAASNQEFLCDLLVSTPALNTEQPQHGLDRFAAASGAILRALRKVSMASCILA